MVNNFYRQRWIGEKIREVLDIAKVIVLSGARQTGKTMFCKNEYPFKEWEYINFDDIFILEEFRKNPKLLRELKKNIIIDEVQKLPQILGIIKRIVDEEERKFLLSGSANLLLMEKVSETLAGRAFYFNLFPFSLGEWRGEKTSNFLKFFKIKDIKEKTVSCPDLKSVLFKGFLPPVLKIKKYNLISKWWESYIRTYLERDLRYISQISSLLDFRNLMELLALRNGCILNETLISRELSMSQSTVHRYINILEISGFYIKLKPYVKSKARRIIKSPKGYYIDTGLICALSGIRKPEEIESEFSGFLLESYILLHLLIYASLEGGKVYYFRTHGRDGEVDFIYEKGKEIYAIEVKLSKNIDFSDIKNILKFREYKKELKFAFVIYTGNKILELTENIFAVPWCWSD